MHLGLSLSLILLGLGQQQDGQLRYVRTQELLEPGINALASVVEMPLDPLRDPKKSPRKEFNAFQWMSAGYASPPNFKGNKQLRVAVYSTNRQDGDEADRKVAMTLMRLWWFNYSRLGIDHNRLYKNGIVDAYLVWSGNEPAGGEQAFETDPDFPRGGLNNNIYIYQLEQFPKPIELLREVCHEYGHATLPPVKGFKKPENFANGMLGEKMYMRYLLHQSRQASVVPNDILGVTTRDLEAFVRNEVDPLIANQLKNGSSAKEMSSGTEASMNKFLGLCLAMQATMPEGIFGKTLRQLEVQSPQGYIQSLFTVVNQEPSVNYTIPKEIMGPVWLPLGKGRIEKGSLVKSNGPWAQINPVAGEVVIAYKPAPKPFVAPTPSFEGH